MSLSAVALLLLGLVPPSFTLIAVLGFFAGLGFGSVMPTTQVTVQTVAGRERLGAATAIVALARSTGAALFGAVVFAASPEFASHASQADHDPATLARAFHHASLMTGCIAALAAFVASWIPHIALWPPKSPDAPPPADG